MGSPRGKHPKGRGRPKSEGPRKIRYVKIAPELHRQLKAHAALSEKALSDVVESLILRGLEGAELPVIGGNSR